MFFLGCMILFLIVSLEVRLCGLLVRNGVYLL